MAALFSPAVAGPADIPGRRPVRLALGLMALVWVVGFLGHFTPLAEWPALFVYGLGSIGLTLWYCTRYHAWREIGLTRANLRAALLWGGLVGGALMLMDMTNTFFYYRGGGAPMAEMEHILVGMRMVYLFPLLVLAEEWLWRGMLFFGLLACGVNRHLVALITTVLYMPNHYAVAPVGFAERGMMAAMALPIGLLGGYMVLKTRNVWAAVLLHGLTMFSMLADVFILPSLAR